MNCFSSHLKKIKIGKRFITPPTVKHYNGKESKIVITHIKACHLTGQLCLKG